MKNIIERIEDLEKLVTIKTQNINGIPVGDTKRGAILLQYNKNMFVISFAFGIKDNFNISGWNDIASIQMPFTSLQTIETHAMGNQPDEDGRTINLRAYMYANSNMLRFGNLGQKFDSTNQNDIWFRGQLVGFVK